MVLLFLFSVCATSLYTLRCNPRKAGHGKGVSTELSFTTQRLLCYQGVWTCGTCMDLIIYQMMQFQVVHVSDCNRAVEVFAGTSISQADFTVASDRNALPEFSVAPDGYPDTP